MPPAFPAHPFGPDPPGPAPDGPRAARTRPRGSPPAPPPLPWVRPYALAARNGFRRGLQYRADHILKVIGGLLFGVVFIAVWQSALRGPGGAATAAVLGVHAAWIAHYVAVSQAMLWITTFLPQGLGIPAAVRTGEVTADLMRPVSFFGLQLAREAGALGYSALLRTLPLAVVFGLLVGLPRPAGPEAVGVAVAATLCGAWIALCLNYLVGISAFWTTCSAWRGFWTSRCGSCRWGSGCGRSWRGRCCTRPTCCFSTNRRWGWTS